MTLNILHFLYKRRFKRKPPTKRDFAPRDKSPLKRPVKKRRQSLAPSLEARPTDSGASDEKAGSSDDPNVKKPRRHKKKEQIPDNASDPGAAADKPKTDSNASTDKTKKAEPEEELTEAELKKEAEVISTTVDASKVFKSFQAHGSGYEISSYVYLPRARDQYCSNLRLSLFAVVSEQ